MRRALRTRAAAFALLPAAAAPATSITASRPHDPKLACKAIERVIAGLNKGRLKVPKSIGPGPTFFSDLFGEVDEKEEAAFLHAIRHSEGKRDSEPMELYYVSTIFKEEHQAIYLVVIERQAWHETRWVEDDMLSSNEVEDPRYARDTSYWLASFRSNEITDFREAGAMYPLLDEATELACHGD